MSQIKRTEHTTKTVEYEFDRKDFITILKKTFPELSEISDQDIKIALEVPSGGDWSGLDLDIGIDTPMKVSFTTSS